MEKVKPYRT